MKIPALSQTETTNPSSAAPGKTQQQEFLRLLVAQLQHQNPLDPQDGSEFVAQLAQFSSLEQATETNSQLANIAAEQASAATASLASFVGRETRFAATSFSISDGAATPPPLAARFDSPIAKGEAIIYNQAGEEVRRIAIGPHAAGEVTLPWDTRTPPLPLNPGNYRIEIKGTAADGSDVSARPTITGMVTALDLSSGEPRLRIGQTTFAPADVISIH